MSPGCVASPSSRREALVSASPASEPGRPISPASIESSSGPTASSSVVSGATTSALDSKTIYATRKVIMPSPPTRHPERSEGSQPRRSFAVSAAQDDGSCRHLLPKRFSPCEGQRERGESAGQRRPIQLVDLLALRRAEARLLQL